MENKVNVYEYFRPVEWQVVADSLVCVAYGLEDDRNEEDWNSSTKPIYYMLIGFALENYYKGTIFSIKSREEVVGNGKLDKFIANHELLHLAEKAGIKTDDNLLKNRLGTLTKDVYWAGRYPIPTKASYLQAQQKNYNLDNGQKIPFISSIDPVIDINEIHKLIDQARENFRIRKK